MNISLLDMSPSYSVSTQFYPVENFSQPAQNDKNVVQNQQGNTDDTSPVAQQNKPFDTLELSNTSPNKDENDISKEECQTCKNRKYQDGSNDPSVSFKTPTKISPDRAAAAVRNHEMEHVFHEQANAKREDREVVSQSVIYKTAICPECHRIYISGGETRTVTRGKQEYDTITDPQQQKGKFFDAVA